VHFVFVDLEIVEWDDMRENGGLGADSMDDTGDGDEDSATSCQKKKKKTLKISERKEWDEE
jgi:hypothetical protein